jgi:hypothetical protein
LLDRSVKPILAEGDLSADARDFIARNVTLVPKWLVIANVLRALPGAEHRSASYPDESASTQRNY